MAKRTLRSIVGDIASQKNIDRLRDASKKAAEKAKGAWIATTGLTTDIATIIADSEWGRSLNSLSNEVTRAMDQGFLDKAKGAIEGVAMTPSNHRILDGGHTVSESLSRAFEIGEQQGLGGIDSFKQWAEAYLSDLSSPAGMPISELSDNVYAMLRGVGISEATARDLVTVNGQEAFDALLSGTLTTLALVFSWRDSDKKNFSKALGSIGLSSVVAMNPVTAIIAVVGLGIGYNRCMIDKQSILRGGLLNATGLAVSAIIPGPLILGAVPAFVLVIYVNKHLKTDVPVSQQLTDLAKYLASQEFRAHALKRYESANATISKSLERVSSKIAQKAA